MIKEGGEGRKEEEKGKEGRENFVARNDGDKNLLRERFDAPEVLKYENTKYRMKKTSR